MVLRSLLEINRIYNMDCLDGMKLYLYDNSVDSIVTDPPYEWGFMDKKWDSTGIAYNVELWKECLRVLKPGGHLLAFGGTRTYHRMTCAIEDAGFEIRDCIQWLYGSGFPKSHDISKAIDKKLGAERKVLGVSPNWRESKRDREKDGEMEVRGENAGLITKPATLKAKQWEGWGTCLKPANEPIVLARKPISEKTIADNVLKWGTGGLNIDGCRIGTDIVGWGGRPSSGYSGGLDTDTSGKPRPVEGRFPANCVTTEPDAFFSKYFNITPPELSKKASRKDRNSDWQGEEISVPLKEKTFGNDKGDGFGRGLSNSKHPTRNNHPTVKPTDLMAWLVRLVTPPGGIVLDPFAGSGTTLVAAKREGFQYIGIEREAEYVEIAKARVG